ncbi:histidine-rich glycoprotein-like [Hylaeus volcanicus]|uniref:histidine-rich glycoprotein-like n=1 Tax=Hylaeus volcanicus TaxID=313075 RepID=UPI0023B7C878|nr:histidine-rich glycoprotein-like [Hylaeus volcanicus]
MTGRISKDKSRYGGSRKPNEEYSTPYRFEHHHIGDDYTYGDFEDGGPIIGKYRTPGDKYSLGKYDDYHYHKNDEDDKDDKPDGYNHNYKHGNSHSHGYTRHHHHTNGEGLDGEGDGYHGYYRVNFDHDHDHRVGGENDHGCGYGGCRHSDNYYDSGFEFHYGNDGKEGDEYNYVGNSDHGEYNDDYAHDSEQSLDHDRNEGVDDHESDYHYGYAEGAGNYGKD